MRSCELVFVEYDLLNLLMIYLLESYVLVGEVEVQRMMVPAVYNSWGKCQKHFEPSAKNKV
jgi:hypothetical protein